ncbi:MAG: pentapeptide repeat-containing protein, partial [Bacteroidia bacterium]|nr:pentapeptide repeat-containing protein [Bacteroidia bacterium]
MKEGEKMNIEIKSRWTGNVLFSFDCQSLKECLVKAVSEKAYLEEAYLKGADLKGANLEGANLKGANLEG